MRKLSSLLAATATALAGKKRGTLAYFWFRGATGRSQKVLYSDRKAGISFRSTRIVSVRFTAGKSRVVIKGIGFVGKKRVRFTLTAVDRGARDTLRIALSSRYTKGGKVLKGGLKIRTVTA